MRPYWLAAGNAESRHAAGRAARRGWEWARETVARILGADPGEVVFTAACYLLKLGSMYVLERRRPDWDAERAQFKKDLTRSIKVAKWTFRQYWKG